MADIICTLLTIALLTASLLYIHGCDRLKPSRAKGNPS